MGRQARATGSGTARKTNKGESALTSLFVLTPMPCKLVLLNFRLRCFNPVF
jgi:hypothetical protein